VVGPDRNAKGDPDRDETSHSYGIDSVHAPKEGDRDVAAVKREQWQEVDDRPSEADPGDERDDRVHGEGVDRVRAKEEECGQAKDNDLRDRAGQAHYDVLRR